VLQIGKKLELLEVLKHHAAPEAEVDLVVSRQEETALVLSHLQQQIHVFSRLESVLLVTGSMHLHKLLHLLVISQLLRTDHVGVQLFLQCHL
jgi:hypothetical protein